MLQTILLVVHILLSIGLIGLILLQQGQGATTGAAFGSGASTTVFGARGSGSFLTRATAILALLFLANSLFLAYRSSATLHQQSLMDRVQTVPVTIEPPQPASDLPPDAVKDPAPGPASAAVTEGAAAEEQTTAVASDTVPVPASEPAATNALPPASP
jgi:preprotein translocase subunit SecG